MTHFKKLTLATLAMIVPAIASAQVEVFDINAVTPGSFFLEPPVEIRQPIPDPGPVIRNVNASPRIGYGGPNAAPAADNTPFCGNADVFFWYEEDANGNEIPGTRQYGCTD